MAYIWNVEQKLKNPIPTSKLPDSYRVHTEGLSKGSHTRDLYLWLTGNPAFRYFPQQY